MHKNNKHTNPAENVEGARERGKKRNASRLKAVYKHKNNMLNWVSITKYCIERHSSRKSDRIRSMGNCFSLSFGQNNTLGSVCDSYFLFFFSVLYSCFSNVFGHKYWLVRTAMCTMHNHGRINTKNTTLHVF